MTHCKIITMYNGIWYQCQWQNVKSGKKSSGATISSKRPSSSFFSRQFDDVSMDDIANAVELSRATLYLYFKDKESLYFAVLLRGIRIMSEIFKESTDRETTGLG